jgi:RNA polymerase sigma-70 factor (ECF subfamily)
MDPKVLKVLVEDAKNGDKEAFREIFELASDRIFAYAYSRTGNRDDALDITQETFIDLWDGLKKLEFRSEEAFYGLVFLIAKRKIYRIYKAHKTNKTVSIEESKEAALKEGSKVEIDSGGYLDKYIAMLTEKYRNVLKLRYFSGMTFGEIANNLDIKNTTAKVWHHRAIKKLKVLLQKHDITF